EARCRVSLLGPVSSPDLPFERASLLGVLVNEHPIPYRLTELTADRLLDGVLAGALIEGRVNAALSTAGLKQLEQLKGSSLVVETYRTYFMLLEAEGNALADSVEQAEGLFATRRNDKF